MKSLRLKFNEFNLEKTYITTPPSLREKVSLLVKRDLERLDCTANCLENKKEIIKKSMEARRNEILNKNKKWIDKHLDFAKENLANGCDVLNSKVEPSIEICANQKQHNLFRMFRYYWSSPYSEYVGRRIKLIIRDLSLSNKPVIGIAALGSPIIHIPERDEHIGWSRETRTRNLNYTMDAYVIGALPPYNYLLGGKLISYILASDEVREVFSRKYGETKYDQLAAIFTTSLYGKSSQYNRLKFRNRLLYLPIGETKGFGTLHLTDETFKAMNEFIKEQGMVISNRFGNGPSWRMRVIRNAGKALGFNPYNLLKHSFKRNIYFVPLAKNSISFLNGIDKSLRYYKQNLKSVTNFWKKRWYKKRKKNYKIIDELKQFKREEFCL